MDTFIETSVNGLMLGSLYSLLALGLILVFKATGIFNLAHGGVLVLGAYVGYEIMVASGLPVWLGFILTVAFGAIVGLLLDRLFMRRMIGQSLFSIFVLTLVLAVLIDAVVVMTWGGQERYLPLVPLEAVKFLGLSVAEPKLYSAGAALFVFLLLLLLFRYSKIGLAMRCVCENVQVSQSLGINVKRIFTISWMVACVIAVVSGVLYGIAYSVNPSISGLGLLKGFPVILLGGMESILGALVGGFVVGLAEIYAAQYMEPAIGTECRIAVVMALMLFILLVKPAGIFGRRPIERI